MHEFSPVSVRKLFPALNREIDSVLPVFLDGPGGSQTPQGVIEAMAEYLRTGNSNLSASPFFAIEKTREVVAQARGNAAALLGCAAEEIVFGANMSTLTAHVSRSIAREWRAGDEIILTALDHCANVSFWEQAAAERGVAVHTARIRPEDCTLDYEHLESLISEKTRLVAFTLASNLCGSLTDAKRVIKAARIANAITYVDGVHYTPHLMLDVKSLGCDFLACSAYKFMGPHLGILFGKQEHLERLSPYKVTPAPDHAPDRWETGTKNFEALAGFNAVFDYININKINGISNIIKQFYDLIKTHEQSWAKAFLERAAGIPGMTIYGITDPKRLAERTPTFAFTLEGRTPQEVSDRLARHHIAAGAGHFYATGVTDALDLTEKGGVVRAGAMHYNTLEELDRFFEILKRL